MECYIQTLNGGPPTLRLLWLKLLDIYVNSSIVDEAAAIKKPKTSLDV